ncbi:hypothetical protein J3Q64DRAFT_1747324 [Phycomyces blakesleeanus]|uniref:Uncharacterized protein n=2 Tax=Phycomyces blakesleeanus TaxID=4837 RepID=A0A162U577_PHYB8|nr:hypothetical protein PHYBLDRAFT_65522 [Phycomyces blakesleeanus NRRL 1555(-)]OAD72433.1 hypothetical protein PHYBLDRAFT_65522 [Phycomyces blakesleeanus NRRL 1555(-)]|eukprot:XP_018290473.1 hypothetical protein PHYBLDRAFT_65522 [Phycomyces blakesleeanus NRRL 1555(-)]
MSYWLKKCSRFAVVTKEGEEAEKDWNWIRDFLNTLDTKAGILSTDAVKSRYIELVDEYKETHDREVAKRGYFEPRSIFEGFLEALMIEDEKMKEEERNPEFKKKRQAIRKHCKARSRELLDRMAATGSMSLRGDDYEEAIYDESKRKEEEKKKEKEEYKLLRSKFDSASPDKKDGTASACVEDVKKIRSMICRAFEDELVATFSRYDLTGASKAERKAIFSEMDELKESLQEIEGSVCKALGTIDKCQSILSKRLSR